MAAKKNPRRKAKTGKESGVETAMEEESEDELPGLVAKTGSDEEDRFGATVIAGARDAAAAIAEAPKFGDARKLVSVFSRVCIQTDTQEPYNFFFQFTRTADIDRGTVHVHAPMWGETPEELRASINFETPDDEDAYGNKLIPVENPPVFQNNYDKLYAAVDKKTGEFKECRDMSECDDTVRWFMKLSGKKMDAMVFEGKKSLIKFTNEIKESKVASDPGVSCLP